MEKEKNKYSRYFGSLTICLIDQDNYENHLSHQINAIDTNGYFIGANSQLLPFLSIQDNLFIGIRKKYMEIYADNLAQWCHFFKLDKTIAQDKTSTLSIEKNLLIHLIRALSEERKLICIDNVHLKLSKEFISQLIPTLENISKEEDISILFLTEDLSFYESIKGNNLLKYKEKSL